RNVPEVPRYRRDVRTPKDSKRYRTEARDRGAGVHPLSDNGKEARLPSSQRSRIASDRTGDRKADSACNPKRPGLLQSATAHPRPASRFAKHNNHDRTEDWP